MKITHTDILKIYSGSAKWYFIVIPSEKVQSGIQRGGWGSIKVECTIGKTEWETSMFWSKKADGYLLFIKKPVRLAEGIVEGDCMTIKIVLQ